MSTKLGEKLKSLSVAEQRAFELVAYLSSAYVVHRDPDPTALRSFLNAVLSDIPPELAKRMMSRDDPADSKTAVSLLENLKDEDLEYLATSPAARNKKFNSSSLAVTLRERVEASRHKIQQNRKIIARKA